MSQKRIHREEYLYLPALTHDTALIAWGAFFFKVKEDDGKEEWELIDDSKLPEKAQRKQSIGETSEAYGAQATVFVTETGTNTTIQKTVTANHAVVTGLKPDTEYAYRVVVREPNKPEREWASGSLRDWNSEKGVMQTGGGGYDNRFRTFPAPDAPAPAVTFAVIGDFGRGIRKPSDPPRCQREVAEAMLAAFNKHPFRFILTTGDNIYAKTFLGLPIGGASGDEDDDWFYTYFQPYRYLLNRVPVFPAIGNHDTKDHEQSVDRDQVLDNLYLRAQSREMKLDAIIEPGLFYRFRYGSAIEFVCLDSSKGKGGKLQFEMPEHKDFIDQAFAGDTSLRWRIPFSHHPAWCAGPQHGDTKSLGAFLLQRGPAAGVRAAFSGHEHNFQVTRDAAGIAHILSGGGGKYREGKPKKSASAASHVWGGNTEGHFLLVEITGDRMALRPIGHLAGGTIREIAVFDHNGARVGMPLTV